MWRKWRIQWSIGETIKSLRLRILGSFDRAIGIAEIRSILTALVLILTIKVLGLAFSSRGIAQPVAWPVEFWLWPNVLNLDAPLVAVSWQVLLAKSMSVRLNPREPWALGLAVWLIYLADHLMDTARPASGEWEPPRKLFFRKHWRQGLAAGIAVALALAVFSSHLLRAPTVRGGLQLGCAVAGYFSFTHLLPMRGPTRWPREIVVALLFTVGTFGAVWLGNGRNVAALAAPAAVFLLLCWTNCSLIETCEWETAKCAPARCKPAGCAELRAPGRAARWATGHVGIVAGLIAFLALLTPIPLGVAGAMSAGVLWMLASNRRAIGIRFVSPLADLALCSPLLLLLVS